MHLETKLFDALIPFSAYKLWFEAMEQGTASGIVSNMFTLLSIFFASVLSVNFINKGYIWTILILGVAVSGISATIWQKDTLYLIVLINCLGCVLYLLLNNREKTKILNRFGFAILFFGICFICALIFSHKQSATGNRFIDLTVHPELRRFVSHNLPYFPLLYGIPGYGYSFQERSLGGSPVLSPLPIFHIKAPNSGRLYLKTDIYDYFDGSNWEITSDLLDESTEDKILLLEGKPTINDNTIQIKILIEFYNKIPFTLETKEIWFKSQLPSLEMMNSLQGFYLQEPLKAGQSVYLELSKEQVTTLPNNSKEAYLQVPKNISNEIREIAKSIADNSDNPNAILSAIDDYLSKTCIYSLNIENLRRSENFLDKFVTEERKGYCVHFATAFAIMARLNNIPTRYNTGFLVNFPAGKNITEVTGLAAHAWPEIWQERQGWLTWEATPAVTPAQYSNYYDDEEFLSIYGFEMEMDSFTLRQIESILGNRTVSIPIKTPDTNNTLIKLNWKYPVLLSSIVLSILVIWILVFRSRNPKITNIELRKLMFIVQKCLLLSYTFGIKHPRYTGWNAWLYKFQKIIFYKDNKLCLMLQRSVIIINGVIYGENLIRNRDLRFFKRLFFKLLIYRILNINKSSPKS